MIDFKPSQRLGGLAVAPAVFSEGSFNAAQASHARGADILTNLNHVHRVFHPVIEEVVHLPIVADEDGHREAFDPAIIPLVQYCSSRWCLIGQKQAAGKPKEPRCYYGSSEALKPSSGLDRLLTNHITYLPQTFLQVLKVQVVFLRKILRLYYSILSSIKGC